MRQCEWRRAKAYTHTHTYINRGAESHSLSAAITAIPFWELAHVNGMYNMDPALACDTLTNILTLSHAPCVSIFRALYVGLIVDACIF